MFRKRARLPILAILCSDADRATLKRAVPEAAVTESWDEAAPLLGSTRFAAVVCDRDLPGRDWRETVRELAKLSPCILLASPILNGSLWQEVVQCGGYDVLAKPLEERHVLKTIEQALRYTALRDNALAHCVENQLRRSM